MELSHFVNFSQMNMNFGARLEKSFKQFKLLRFSVERGHRCRERFWQFGNFVDIVMEVRIFDVVCQLLRGKQKLVCFDRRSGIVRAELWSTGRALLFPLS